MTIYVKAVWNGETSVYGKSSHPVKFPHGKLPTQNFPPGKVPNPKVESVEKFPHLKKCFYLKFIIFKKNVNAFENL